MKKHIAAATSVLLAGVLVACSGGTEEPEPFPSPTPGTTSTLNVWLLREGPQPRADLVRQLQRDTARFDEANVRIELIPAAQLRERLAQAKNNGWSPDIVELPANETLSYASQGMLSDLLPAIEDHGIEKDLTVAMRKLAEADDAVYGMPFSMTSRAFIYNKEIFAAAGINQPPKTWDEIVNAKQAIERQRPNITAWPISAEPSALYPFLLAGVDIGQLRQDDWPGLVNRPQAVQSLQQYAAADQAWSDEQIAAAIADGKAAMGVLNSRSIRDIIKQEPKMDLKLGVLDVPGDDGHVAPVVIEGTHLVMPAASKRKHIAWPVVLRMSTSNFNVAWNQQRGSYSGMKSLVEQQLMSSTVLERPFVRPMVERGIPGPCTPRRTEFDAAINDMLDEVIAGRQSASQAADQTAAKLTEILR